MKKWQIRVIKNKPTQVRIKHKLWGLKGKVFGFFDTRSEAVEWAKMYLATCWKRYEYHKIC